MLSGETVTWAKAESENKRFKIAIDKNCFIGTLRIFNKNRTRKNADSMDFHGLFKKICANLLNQRKSASCFLEKIKRQTGIDNFGSGAVIDVKNKIIGAGEGIRKTNKRLHPEFSEFAFFDVEIISKLHIEI
jgi:hypothetical protein